MQPYLTAAPSYAILTFSICGRTTKRTTLIPDAARAQFSRALERLRSAALGSLPDFSLFASAAGPRDSEGEKDGEEDRAPRMPHPLASFLSYGKGGSVRTLRCLAVVAHPVLSPHCHGAMVNTATPARNPRGGSALCLLQARRRRPAQLGAQKRAVRAQRVSCGHSAAGVRSM
jgi:hypothetical protein